MKFAVFTHVNHKELEGQYYAYSPYVREMNIWFKYMDEVQVVAPLNERRGKSKKVKKGKKEEEKGRLGESYNHKKLVFTSISGFNLLNFWDGLNAFFKIPIIFFIILAEMRKADHLHLRCPGNIGLLACIAQVFFPKKPKTAKYAGNWDPGAKQPWTYRFQKWILSNTFLSRNIKVLVYGDWPNQKKNIVPFFTASFSERDREVRHKDFTPPYKFVYTGNLVQGKGVIETITLIETLRGKGVDAKLEIYGDGILENSLRAIIQNKKLQNLVELKGRKSLEELKQAYKEAHFVVLLSKSEGWPKTLAEAMFFGVIPISTRVSCVPWILGAGKRGILFDNEERFAAQLDTMLSEPSELRKMSILAQEWSQIYTLEKFSSEIQKHL